MGECGWLGCSLGQVAPPLAFCQLGACPIEALYSGFRAKLAETRRIIFKRRESNSSCLRGGHSPKSNLCSGGPGRLTHSRSVVAPASIAARFEPLREVA